MRPRSFTDRELLETARACFLAHGPQVSTTHIAEELGVSQAALFKRYPTKRALLIAALLPHQPPAWIAGVLRGPDERPVRQQLRQIMDSIHAFFEDAVPCWSVMRAAGIMPEDAVQWGDPPPPVLAHRALADWFRQIDASGRGRVADPESTALTMIASLQAPHMLRHVLGERAPLANETYRNNLADMIWAAIAPDDAAIATREGAAQ